MLLLEQRNQEMSDQERDLNIFRSGSAPPTVDGSINAVGGILGQEVRAGVLDLLESQNRNEPSYEEELRSHPAYFSYYYSHVNLNPRLPPPLLSKEDSRSIHRLQVGRSATERFGNRRTMNRWDEGGSVSLLSQQLMLTPEELAVDPREVPEKREWLDNTEAGLVQYSLGRQKSFADDLQVIFHAENFSSTISISCSILFYFTYCCSMFFCLWRVILEIVSHVLSFVGLELYSMKNLKLLANMFILPFRLF